MQGMQCMLITPPQASSKWQSKPVQHSTWQRKGVVPAAAQSSVMRGKCNERLAVLMTTIQSSPEPGAAQGSACVITTAVQCVAV